MKKKKNIPIYVYLLILIISLNTPLWAQKNNTTTNNPLKITSWNIRDLGRTKNDIEIHKIATIIKGFDIVAIQEVVAKDPAGAQAVAKIADELNRMGTKWDYRISDPTNSPSVYMSERYAYIWKTSKVKIISKPYLDTELAEKCYREPYIAKFQMKNNPEPFYLVNYHSRKHDDHPEQEIIHLKDYPERLNSEQIFIVGDFNLNEKHEVWDEFYNKGFKPALQNSKTTLKTACKDGVYLNHSIDNIYYTSQTINNINSGAIDFVNDCNLLENARYLSDHLPVFLEFQLK